MKDPVGCASNTKTQKTDSEVLYLSHLLQEQTDNHVESIIILCKLFSRPMMLETVKLGSAEMFPLSHEIL